MKLISTGSFIEYMALNANLTSTDNFVDTILVDSTYIIESVLSTSFSRQSITDTFFLSKNHPQYSEYSYGRWHLLGLSNQFVDNSVPLVYKVSADITKVAGEDPTSFQYPILDYNKGYLKLQSLDDLSKVSSYPYLQVTYTSGFQSEADPDSTSPVYTEVPQALKTACQLQARLFYGYRKQLQESSSSGKKITSPGLDTGAKAILIQYMRGFGPLYNPEIDFV